MITVPGYARISSPRARGIALETFRATLESILQNETLYSFAARQPDARKFMGRAPVYAIQLPEGGGDVVVRRSMRGGLLANLNLDLFLPPTRGLRELITSLRLRLAGVQTPEVVAFIVYPVAGILRRGDVITREVQGEDLASMLAAGTGEERRRTALEAAASLTASLSRVGAHHPDLNLRNVVITETDGAASAWILDIDRIRFHVPGDPIVLRANIERLERSLRKRRETGEIEISDAELATLHERVMELAQ